MLDDIEDLRRSVRHWKGACQQARDDAFDYRHELQRLKNFRDESATRNRRLEREFDVTVANLRAEVDRHRGWRLELQLERDEALLRVKKLEEELQKIRKPDADGHGRPFEPSRRKPAEIKPGETDDVIVTISGLWAIKTETFKFVVSPEDAEAAFQWSKDPRVPSEGEQPRKRKVCFSLHCGEGPHEVGQKLQPELRGFKVTVNDEIIPGYFSTWRNKTVPPPLDLSALIAPGKNVLRVSGSGLAWPENKLTLRKEGPSVEAEAYIRRVKMTSGGPFDD